MSMGAMRERVAFVREGRTQRTDGGFDSADATLSTVWASVRPVAANEREEAGRLHGATSYLITIHAMSKPSDLSTGDSVTWSTAPGGAVRLNLRAVRQSDRGHLYLDMVCDAGVLL